MDARLLFGQAKLALVYLVDILAVHNLHGGNAFIARGAEDVGSFLREVVDKDAGIILGNPVPMNL
ncbi:MAG TPA: hypothetical protein DCX54_11120 [Flavobacteriales bacterium]|nr:hypothetical protein [Flavobacteriales bacterium]